MLGYILVLAVLVLFFMGLGMFCGWLVSAYLNRKVAHEELELQVTKTMSELVAEMRDEGEFSDKQKAYLHNLLHLSESKSFVRFYFMKSLFSSTSGQSRNSKQFMGDLESLSGFSRDGKNFNNVIALIILSILGGSTHNFFLGGFFRNLLFANTSEDLKLVKETVKEEAIVYRPIFSNFVEKMSLAA